MFLFYHDVIDNELLTLSPEESRHCVKALRHKNGDLIQVTDGYGHLVTGEILDAHLQKCLIRIIERHLNPQRSLFLHIAVAPTKNVDRMEWLVEKAIEMGVEKISFIQCDHSERVHVDLNRMHRIAVSAMKQSQTTRIPEMELISLLQFFSQYGEENCDKLIAWCDADTQSQLINYKINTDKIILLIGPEGDFSRREIEIAFQKGFESVKLGNRRLRTETAALYGCAVLAAKELNVERKNNL